MHYKKPLPNPAGAFCCVRYDRLADLPVWERE
jgi:hypothetical protein